MKTWLHHVRTSAARAGSRVRALHRNDTGTAAVSFLLCLPIFLTIVAIIVQYALLVNAKIIVTSAAANAARAAMTSLPDETLDNVKKAACFSLVPVSPRVMVASAEGLEIANAVAALKVDPNWSSLQRDRFIAEFVPSFATRYTYAQHAVSVEYPQRSYKYLPGQDIEVIIHYKMFLTVPIWGTVFGQEDPQLAALLPPPPGPPRQNPPPRRFFTVSSTVRVQTAHGRGAWGNPQ